MPTSGESCQLTNNWQSLTPRASWSLPVGDRRMLSPEIDLWRTVEQDARAHALTTLGALEAAPLEFGHVVAWVTCRFGRTDNLSEVHRAGAPIGETPVTLCGEVIPSAVLRLSLSPNLVRSLGKCRYCETAYLQQRTAAA